MRYNNFMKRDLDHAVVSVLVVSNDNKFLLVQETKPGREGQYNFPGRAR